MRTNLKTRRRLRHQSALIAKRLEQTGVTTRPANVKTLRKYAFPPSAWVYGIHGRLNELPEGQK